MLMIKIKDFNKVNGKFCLWQSYMFVSESAYFYLDRRCNTEDVSQHEQYDYKAMVVSTVKFIKEQKENTHE